MTRHPPVLRYSGDGVTDFPDQKQPLKSLTDPDLHRTRVPIVYHV